MAVEAATASEAPPAAPAPSEVDALAVQGLVRRFGERAALAGVSAQLGRGQTLAVFGPNGAGKTTLLRVLATLLQPHAGSVRVLGLELPDHAPAARSRIGLVGHEPLLYRDLSGRENLRFYTRLYDVPGPERRIAELLDVTGMTRRADEPLRTLSRGMVQRLAVCRAVLHQPELLLLDEPREGLDPDAAELVEPLIGRGCGATRVLVTHQIEGGMAEADRALGLRAGKAVFETPTQAITPQQVRTLYGHEVQP